MLPTKPVPPASPAQAIQISPEALMVANCYLGCQNMTTVSQELDMPVEKISEVLDRREVRAYIDRIFFDTGFNSRFKMRGIMDIIIQKKLQELDEAEVGSSKDIADLLALSHKMTMELMDKQIQLEKAQQANNKISTQVNMQVNEFGDGTKYGSLIQRLLEGNK